MNSELPTVSIIIPVHNKVSFTRQCLDRIDRFGATASYEVIVVDNGSTDGTRQFLESASSWKAPHRYVRNDSNLGFARGNNIGALLSTSKYLLFLNNDTLVRAGWLDAMVRVAEGNPEVGIVGIQQRFPYTNLIHHTGIIFAADGSPQHIYPHADASLPHVNKQRSYQAVTGACLLIGRELFAECGMFDEGYVNGYEDIDLCLTVRARKRSIICCTSSFIYHYGQITDTRTADDPQNAARLKAKWNGGIVSDELTYFNEDRSDAARAASTARPAPRKAASDLVYFADDLSTKSALNWATADLVLALDRLGVQVALKRCTLPSDTDSPRRTALEKLMVPEQPVGGTQIRWSHYWPQHLERELNGVLNFELFVINYLFARPGTEPWDYWLQTVPFNRIRKLPLSGFCRDVLTQIGVPATDCTLVQPGYSPEALTIDPRRRADSRVRILTVTNSHDLERYGTELLIDAYWRAFTATDDVILVVKDYGAASGNDRLARLLQAGHGRAAVELHTDFLSKADLIRLYKSCDAFVSSHRGEGYGMKILDAMACGLPVVTTLFGGPADFCRPDNCLPIDFTLVPVGACYDTRAIRINNGPSWAEPDPESLVRRLRQVADDPSGARQLGERARREVVPRFTWENAAKQLTDAIAATDRPNVHHSPVVRANPTERSPYWMGLRVSVVVPTHNRKMTLRKCLRALEEQTVLPQEFEVVVVDDGSTDGTREMLESERFPFSLTYLHQPNSGPGMARNLGVTRAQGEIVLFVGDDILADPQLLEQHLIAHSEMPGEATAILGHIDWPPGLPRSPVMDFVCGDSSLQFAYTHIPHLPKLDYRFFYTSNISLRRRFLVDAANDGVRFDPLFRYAAFEDSEFAFRLQSRGLDLRYHSDALAYHDHLMDIAGFGRREYHAGMMAVVFYRMHPQLDPQLDVRWIGDWTLPVRNLCEHPELDARIAVLDRETDNVLRSAACTIENLHSLRHSPEASSIHLGGDSLKNMLDSILATIFDIQRTRGKVEEWYSSVEDRRVVESAKRLIATVRKLEFLSATPAEVKKLRGTIAWLDQEVVADLKRRVGELTQQLGTTAPHQPTVRLRHAIVQTLRRADLLIQRNLRDRNRLLTRYQRARGRLAGMLRGARVIG